MPKKRKGIRKSDRAKTNLVTKEERMKRAIKDSVFTFLFGKPEYTLQLYQALHPEDGEATIEDLRSVTLRRIISTGIYNDLGFRVGDKVMVLSEAQSTFSVNISLRLLLYLAPTYQEYVREKKLDLYATTPVKIPRPELYVIYSGEENVPECLHLADLYEGEGSVDLTVKVLRRDGSRSIIDQYLRFCEITDEQRKLYGYTKQAIEETIRICIEEGILVAFLEQCRQEVVTIMDSLFDQAEISRIHDHNVREAGMAEGKAVGMVEGIFEGVLETVKNIIQNLQVPVDRALEIAGVPEANREKYKMLIG